MSNKKSHRSHFEEYRLSKNVCNEVSFLNTPIQWLMEASGQKWLEIAQTMKGTTYIGVLSYTDINSFIIK